MFYGEAFRLEGKRFSTLPTAFGLFWKSLRLWKALKTSVCTSNGTWVALKARISINSELVVVGMLPAFGSC